MAVNFDDLTPRAAALLDRCRAGGLRLTTAESCTGGLIAGCLTEIAGSSDVVDRGFVTYSNAAKSDLLDVDPGLIERHGAVSAQVVRAMAVGALKHSDSDLCIAVTGIAGPGGASPSKPIGLVYIGAAGRDGEVRVERHMFPGDRGQVRYAAVEAALTLCLSSFDSETQQA